MITLVVIGVFFVLYANNDSPGTSIGSAIVGYAVGNAEVKDQGQTGLNPKTSGESKLGTKEIAFSLSLDNVPAVDEETSIDAINLVFNKPETAIKINNDKLELNSLEEVNFRISSFNGQFILEADKLSLSGSAKGIEVNGLKFSSEEVIKISFEKLDYNLLDISGIRFKELNFNKGNGKLKIGEKLNYPLEDEEVQMLEFKGSMKINEKSNSSLLNIDGNAGSIGVSGSLIDFSLR